MGLSLSSAHGRAIVRPSLHPPLSGAFFGGQSESLFNNQEIIMIEQTKTESIMIRIPAYMKNEIAAAAKKKQRKPSDWARLAIETQLKKEARQ